MSACSQARCYRGRLAPTPTGYMHLGHARTFLVAQARARAAGGVLVMRIEDLDRPRCKPEFVESLFEDLRWAGLEWQEGPDIGGPFAPYSQSERLHRFEAAWKKLRNDGSIYPCVCSRRDVAQAATAPHEESGEVIYPGTCRGKSLRFSREEAAKAINWRFRVPDGEAIEFVDQRLGPQRFMPGEDFGDFLVWRKDGIPSYELAVTVDDIEMEISEVVRGEDLLMSTARQILLYRALGCEPPAWCHCPLVCDEDGRRLAKRHKSMSLREMRSRGCDARSLLEEGRVSQDSA